MRHLRRLGTPSTRRRSTFLLALTVLPSMVSLARLNPHLPF